MSKLTKQILRKNSTYHFFALLAIAVIISITPIVHVPFTWMNSFFHEISHGLAAILTGGEIRKIELNIDGSGICGTAGGHRFITAFSGYSGALIWGALIYMLSNSTCPKRANTIACAILLLLFATLIFWTRDMVTAIILGVMMIPFAIILKTKHLIFEQYFMQLTGIYIILDAIKTPTYLLHTTTGGDAETLADLTWLPAFFWIFLWFGLGICTLLYLCYMHVKSSKTSINS